MASSTAGGAGLLSTPLLAAIAGGTMILLTGTSIVLYCCVRRAKRPSKRMPKAILRVISPLAAHEKRQQVTSPPPVFDFSPPSPHWKPAPPSIALIMQKNVHDFRSIAPGLGYATKNHPPLGPRRDMPPALLTVQQRPARIRPQPVPPLPTKSRERNLRDAPIATDPRQRVKNTALLSNTKDRRSGLGISTINLDLRSNITLQGSQIHTFGEPPFPPKDRPMVHSRPQAFVCDKTLVNEPNGKNSTTRPQDRSSVYLAYDDVKLAYAASISSLISEKDERILSMKRRRDAKPSVKLMDEKDAQMPAGPSVFITTSYNPSGDIGPAPNTASGGGNQGNNEAIKKYVNSFHRCAN